MSLGPPTRLGSYEVIGLLGAGGMGEVYRARDTKLRRDVALKILPEAFAADPDRRARFTREAHVLASLNHPNVAAIYGIEEAEGKTALVLELVDGPTLADRIARGPVPVDETLKIAGQIADALDAAHEKGIVHRDLKPANIKVPDDGPVKVLDFGLAKALTEEAPDASISPTMTAMASRLGVIVGTAAYMSPEQTRGKPVDKRADIWAFGCVLFEMLTARRAFEAEDVAGFIVAVMTKEPDWTRLPPATPPRVAELLRRCLKKDPRERLRDIGDAKPELDLSGRAATISTTAIQRSLPAWQRFALPVVALAAVIELTLLARAWLRPAPVPSRAVQFTFGAPERVRFDAGAPVPSPDGTQIAFGARPASGQRSLWVRHVSSAEVRQVADTEGAEGAPFWSADSRWLAFFAQGKLKKVSLAGGPALTICPMGANLGGTWSQDNIIVFAPINRTVLNKVSAAGGTPEPITTLSEDRKENSHRAPQFLPDGRHFLFTARSDVIQNNLVYIGSLDSKEIKPLLPAQSNAAYAAGFLLFVREGSLFAQRFDAGTLTLSGEPVVVASPVVHSTPNSQAAFGVSSDGTVLAYKAGIVALASLTWFDRSGKVIGTVGVERNYTDVRLSPDGKASAVVVPDPDSGNRDIWLVDARTGMTTRFTSNPANDWQMAWSPDSRRLAFASDRNGRSSVYVKPIDGGTEELLARLPERGLFPKDWSKDGSLLTLGIDNAAGIPSLGAMRLSGDRAPFPVGPGTSQRENELVLSPDGQWMAFVSRQSGRDEVYVARFPNGGRRQVSAGGGGPPRWSADGTALYYVSADGWIMAVQFRGRDQGQAESPVRLFQPCAGSPPGGVAGAYPFDVAADGTRFLAVCASPSSNPTAITVAVNWATALR